MRRVIRAVIFDLDGTLVETEVLKARSYARAAVELCPGAIDEQAILHAYGEMVGRSREEVAAGLLTRFGLERAALARMGELGASSAVQVYLDLRIRIYESMLADRAMVKAQEYPYATALMRRLHEAGWPIGIATMSHRKQAEPVLEILGLGGEVDVLVTRDDVVRPKPDPEIYALTTARLGVLPEECLAIEDSLPGVQSALAARLTCVAVSTALTRHALHGSDVISVARLVDDPKELEAVVLPLLGGRAEAMA